MPGDYVHVYFQNGDALEELKELAKTINTSVSALVSGLTEAALPSLRKAAEQNKREVEMTIRVPLFGGNDGQS